MSLKEKLMADMKSAMKERNTALKNTITLLRASILQFEKDNLTEASDEIVVDIFTKEIKRRRDAIQDFIKGSRQDLADSYQYEIDVINTYMPEQLSQEDVTKIIQEAIASLGALSIKDMGKVVAEVMDKVKGRTDGKLVSSITKSLLSK